MRTAPVGCTKGGKRRRNRSVFDKNTFFEARTKKRKPIFSGAQIFLLVGSPERPYFGSQGHMRPQTGFSGSAFSMRSNLVDGRFVHNGSRDRRNPFRGIFGPFQAPGGREISLSPPDPPKSSELRPQEAKLSKLQTVRSFATRTRFRWAKKIPESHRRQPSSSRNGAELRPKRRPAGNIWFNPGPHPPRVGDHPQKPVTRELPGKLLNTTQRRRRTKVVHH